MAFRVKGLGLIVCDIGLSGLRREYDLGLSVQLVQLILGFTALKGLAFKVWGVVDMKSRFSQFSNRQSCCLRSTERGEPSERRN